ncbi:hypothetical protein N7504_000566 [Penicillium tannophilum]|nr:hypothetical protein N7504_000566 [Penicillium tannophilum]
MAWYSILPPQLTQVESWAVRVFLLLGFITIVPWFALILFDAGLWLYRIILWELPWVGGRARGQQRPRAPSLNERPDGQRRAFGLRGVESDSGPDQDSGGDTMADGNTGKENMAPTTGASHSSVDGELLEQHHDIVVAVNNTPTADRRTHYAVRELYTFVLGKYLPSRYPGIFKLHPSTDNGSEIFENTVTGASWPTTLHAETPTIRALEILAQTVDEEFLILLPDISSSHQPKYILQAYATCFPSGFNTREKLGLRLADIHTPVPGYADKLERSMDRFFAKVEVGRFVKRVNWSVTTETELFAAFGSVHGSHVLEDKLKDKPALRLEELNIDQTVLRCERQTLHRLPESKAVVFAFHTYTYPIRQIRDEGLGEELAIAIDGLKKGNVPAMHAYKRGDYWGEAVKEFLRS